MCSQDTVRFQQLVTSLLKILKLFVLVRIKKLSMSLVVSVSVLYLHFLELLKNKRVSLSLLKAIFTDSLKEFVTENKIRFNQQFGSLITLSLV